MTLIQFISLRLVSCIVNLLFINLPSASHIPVRSDGGQETHPLAGACHLSAAYASVPLCYDLSLSYLPAIASLSLLPAQSGLSQVCFHYYVITFIIEFIESFSG